MKIYAGFQYQTHLRTSFFGRSSLRLVILRLVLISERGRVFDCVLTRHNEDKVLHEMFDFVRAESKEEPVVLFCREHYDVFLFQGMMTHTLAVDLDVQYLVIGQTIAEYMDLLDEADFTEDEVYSFKALRSSEEAPFTTLQKIDMFKSHVDYPADDYVDADLQDKVLYLKSVEQFVSRHREKHINILKFMTTDEADNSEE